MNHAEWSHLDDLLRKAGYGGYYDYIEVLKTIARNLVKDDDHPILEKIEKIKDIKKATTMLKVLSFAVANTGKAVEKK